jgi:hypothetical protein
MFWRNILGVSSKTVGRWWEYILTETTVPIGQAKQSPNSEGNNFESLIFCISRALYHCYKTTEYVYYAMNRPYYFTLYFDVSRSMLEKI